MEIRHFVSTKGNEMNKGTEGRNASAKLMGTNYKQSYNGTLICFIFREESKYAFKNAFIIKSQGAAPHLPDPCKQVHVLKTQALYGLCLTQFSFYFELLLSLLFSLPVSCWYNKFSQSEAGLPPMCLPSCRFQVSITAPNLLCQC